jgi:hypothetical protein
VTKRNTCSGGNKARYRAYKAMSKSKTSAPRPALKRRPDEQARLDEFARRIESSLNEVFRKKPPKSRATKPYNESPRAG